ncbi:MAG TPA: HPF/RaiA family ribosome-associated protein [Candidatus Margulisiibacteriota bacterium]|nr:HPF/RaiA family ribosome-associated protein [Candidatus Margulisiibacteriota bacterium]
MQLPLQISFRGMEPSDAVETKVRERAARLDRFYDRIMGCRVVVESPHRRHHQGKLFHVRVDLTVPGGELAVTREPAEHHAYEDVFVAIRDAFDAAQRQLEDYARRQRGDLKTHEGLPTGRVSKLFPDEEYGFIETPEGAEVYFHKHSVLDKAFDRLVAGSEVEFVEEQGEKGPQASTVRVIEKRRR